MGFVTGRQPLLEGQPLVLLGLLRGGRRQGQLIQGFSVQLGLLRQLLAVTPVLKLPGTAEAETDHCDDA